MIYDRVVTIHDIDGASVLGQKLTVPGVSHYCARRKVGLTRYYTALQVGDRTDEVLELPGRDEITTSQIAVTQGAQFRILQVQHETDEDGLPVTVLSLSRLEELYDLDVAEGAP